METLIVVPPAISVPVLVELQSIHAAVALALPTARVLSPNMINARILFFIVSSPCEKKHFVGYLSVTGKLHAVLRMVYTTPCIHNKISLRVISGVLPG